MAFYQKRTWVLFAAFAVLMVSIGFHFACNNKNSSHVSKGNDGHQEMIDILAKVQSTINNPQNRFSAEAKLAYCDSMLRTTPELTKQFELATRRGDILLEMGKENEAIYMYQQVLNRSDISPQFRNWVSAMLGMAYMRLAERMNCVNFHSADACIMPIQGNGIHLDKTPMQMAIGLFETVLKNDPSDLNSRWLLNIAYMTLGEYPKKVPAEWLIPGLDKPGKTTVKPFTDIAGDLGIQTNNRAGGVIVEDFNNDGYLDIVTTAWGLDDPMHFFKNNADGSFTDASKASGLGAITGGLNCQQTDYNNDGFADIFVLRGGWQGEAACGEQPNSLIRNNGDGTFTDVTIEAGLLTYRPTQTATWNDFNNDGWLDLFVGNETFAADKTYPCEFYINNHDGTFTNIANEDFHITAFVKGVVSGDFDNDGWADLFLSCQSGEKILLHNLRVPGKVPQFENYSQKAGLADLNASTFPTFFFDYNNDGFLDIFACNYEFKQPLSHYIANEMLHPSNDRTGKIYIFQNNQNGTFTNVSDKMHLNETVFAMGANFGDIDNDGWLDMYFGTGNPNYQSLVPNRLYKNLGGKDFADVTVSARVGNLQKGHGVSFADLNNNGDQDIYVEMGGAYRGDAYFSSFYLNPGQSDNNWICVKLEGSKSNKAGIGSRVAVRFHENGKERVVYRDVNSGGSFGASPLRREIGIGKATMIDEIVIYWPASGITQNIKHVKPNQFIMVTEGQEGFQVLDVKPLTFKMKDGSIPMCATATAAK